MILPPVEKNTLESEHLFLYIGMTLDEEWYVGKVDNLLIEDVTRLIQKKRLEKSCHIKQ